MPPRRVNRRALPEDPNAPERFGVILVTPESKEKWKTLVNLKTAPSRYMDDNAMQTLDIYEDVKRVLHQGGLLGAFTGHWASHRLLMLEFLSTLTLDKYRFPARLKKMKFRLKNRDFELTHHEVTQIFGPRDANLAPPEVYNQDVAWHQLTSSGPLPEPVPPFVARTEKSSKIRNPVFRYIHRVLAHSLFARHDSGTITVAELLCLWSMANNYKMDMSSFIADHLLRASNKQKGILMCGGVITAIANFCHIDTSEMEAMEGSTLCDLSSLISMHFLRVDRRGHLYVSVNGVGEFPVPNRALTRPGPASSAMNWSMDTPEHHAAMQADLPILPYRGSVIPRLDDDIPFGANNEMEQDENQDDEEERDEGERRSDQEPSHISLTHEQPESSRASIRRRRRNTDEENQLAAIGQRVTRIETSVENLQGDVTTILEMMRHWGHPSTWPRYPPPPPSPPHPPPP